MATNEIERLNKVLRERNYDLSQNQSTYKDMEINF